MGDVVGQRYGYQGVDEGGSDLGAGKLLPGGQGCEPRGRRRYAPMRMAGAKARPTVSAATLPLDSRPPPPRRADQVSHSSDLDVLPQWRRLEAVERHRRQHHDDEDQGVGGHARPAGQPNGPRSQVELALAGTGALPSRRSSSRSRPGMGRRRPRSRRIGIRWVPLSPLVRTAPECRRPRRNTRRI